MTSVLEFRQREVLGWCAAPAACSLCAHEWIAVYLNPAASLECPGCHAMAGQVFPPAIQAPVWRVP